MKRLFLLASAIVLSVSPIISYAQVGITSVPFLLIEPDSRGAAMGNTGVAIADNASAIFWNPAGLAFQEGNQASLTHSNWLKNFNVSDLFYDYVVGKMEFEGIGTVGAHITFLNLGQQAVTDERSPEVISTFNSYELAVGLGYGFEISRNFALGTGFRFIYSDLASGLRVGEQKASAARSLAIDLGGLYRTDNFMIGANRARFSAGFNLANLGPGMQYTDNAQKDPLPTTLRMGIAFDYDLDPEGFNRITWATDVTKIMARKEAFEVASGDTTITEYRAVSAVSALFDSWNTYTHFNGQEFVDVSLLQQFMIGTGMEYWYDNTFALRGGFYYEDPNNGDRKYITLGAGLRYNLFGVDFSYIRTLESDHPLANTLRFSVLFNF